MYRVIFKGKMEDMYLDTIDGVKLMEFLKSDSQEEFVELQGSLIELKSIKAIIPNSSNPDTSKQLKQGSGYIAEEFEKFRKEKSRFLAMSPAQRSKFTDDADMLSVAVQGRRLTDEEKQEVIKCKEMFFTEHPDYAFANPICYKDVLKQTRAGKSTKEIRHISDLLPGNALNLMELVVRNGIKRPFDL